MKNIYRYLLIFTASALVVSCGESDLEPTLALDKDLDSYVKNQMIKIEVLDKRVKYRAKQIQVVGKIV